MAYAEGPDLTEAADYDYAVFKIFIENSLDIARAKHSPLFSETFNNRLGGLLLHDLSAFHFTAPKTNEIYLPIIHSLFPS